MNVLRKDTWRGIIVSLFFFTYQRKNVCLVKLKPCTNNSPSLTTNEKYLICACIIYDPPSKLGTGF